MIKHYTLQHLARFIMFAIPHDDHRPFHAYALNKLDEDEAYWTAHGWGVLYTRYRMERDQTPPGPTPQKAGS